MTRWHLVGGALSVALGCAVVDGPDAADAGESTDAGEDAATDGEQTGGGSEDCDDACGDDAVDETGSPIESDCIDGVDNDGDQQIDCSDSDCASSAACGDRTLRLATWNTLRIGAVGSEEYEALLAIVLRLNVDVLCLQEIGEGEESQLQALATAGGYNYGLLAPASGVPGAGIANACMSRIPTVDAAYLWADWISPDPSARDLTRPYVRLRIQHPTADRYISILSGHLKAGGDDVDRFRRMVDSIRLGQAAAAEGEEFPGNAVVVLGDFNDGPNPTTSTFSSLPADLPAFYNLGSDITLPFTYAPGQPLLDAGLSRVEARWEDTTEDDTFIPFASRLDYIYVSDEEIVASEVYESCNDDGVDAEPLGDVFSKAGDPLPCGIGEIASDHRPVVVELRLR